MDEPALREGLPLKQDRWESYLEWAVDSFRLSTAVAQPHTQIVTHLCYSDFQDILKACTLLAFHFGTIKQHHVYGTHVVPGHE